ncbi:hypothetical protein SAPIO_CDS10507 [Scedosporium apiospermum]|uniref:DUF1996 domain-containing protein n=1 Tax=Pseudallescheria apiosperma TaxID=563466 RepID=A0A084FVK4_PSEDA|nr:uncharacterized protein SAPIO_CDS10507 [Scedosporium apiospermum]KEZ39116.1 hypothetical protein SAPIO_CDS10507 [Scedosporium apiospermum]
MRLSTLAFVAAVEAQFLQGLNHLRFGCEQITIERLDPLVNPGQAPTPHMHQVVGGNAFNATMPSTDISKLATCTTCGPADDFSNYWTANVYFKARNGSYRRVPQMANRLLFGDRFTTQTKGGVTVYYIAPSKNTVTAFQPGFRMLVGDPMRREPLYKSQSCFRCYSGPNHGGDNAAPCSDNRLDFEGFPNIPCLGGIRSNVLYPTCWDGKNLDSANHQDHVSYPSRGPSNFLSTGDCPASHPVKIPQLMLEVIWDTTGFNDKSQWPEDGSQPFVLSTGDPTGYGQHGDYVFGWKDDALQRAMDDQGCFSATCGNQKSQDISEAQKCTIEKTVLEDVDGWLTELPGVPMS